MNVEQGILNVEVGNIHYVTFPLKRDLIFNI
jgi:hypothetical protein